MKLRVLISVVGLALACSAFAQDAKPRADWPNFGNDAGGSQYSPLDQINTKNIGKLKVAWTHRSGDLPGSPPGIYGLEAVPIQANGMLYYCTSFNRVFALDPATGKEKWVFDPTVAKGPNGKPLLEKPKRPMTCRGVSYWEAKEPQQGAACQKRIYKGDAYANLYAMDADTGASCEDFGAAKGHPGYITHLDYDNHGEGFAGGMGSPAAIVGDVVVIASSANDGLTNAADGVVRGFDARSGDLKWEFNPIPADMSDKTGAANVWSTMSADVERGLVFLPTTSPSTDYYGGERLFDIPLSDSTVAVSTETGKVVWSFQTVHHDTFDYDLVGHPLLVKIKKDGKEIDVAITQTKTGWLFVHERATGAPVWPIEERAVPQSDVPGEKSSPTQPVPVGIDAFAGQIIKREDLFGLTPLDKAWCQREFDKMRYDGMYTPPSEKGSLLFPSALGGGNWGGAAFDPVNNTLVIKAENLATRLKFIKKSDMEKEDKTPGVDYLTRPLQGTPYRAEGEVFMSPLGIPCSPAPWGTLSAIDMGTGKLKWKIPLGQVKKYGITIPASFGWGSPNIGGPIVTAGGLIFIAATMDEKLRAIDTVNGQELWQSKLPVPGMSVPMTYMAGGKQYVVIAAGGHSRAETALGDYLIAYTLAD